MKISRNLRKSILILTSVTSAMILLGGLAASLGTAQPALADDTSQRVSKNNEYMTQAKVIFQQQMLEEENLAMYKQERANASSEEQRQDLDSKIKESEEKLKAIHEEFQKIQTLNVALFALTPDVEEKLYSVEKFLIDKYMDDASDSYKAGNPVVVIDSFPLTRSIKITLDTAKISTDGSNIPNERNIDGIPIEIAYGKPVEVGCTPDNRLTGVCRPVLGGVSTAEKDSVPSNSKNTIGYKALKGGVLGFVMAGHSAVGSGKIIVQPYNDATKRVGVVGTGAFCLNGFVCDFAWVDIDSGISVQDDIYTTCYTCRYDIGSKYAESSQTPGLLVTKAGVGLGVTMGQITSNSPNNHYILTDMDAAGGDSGAPVFQNSGVIATLYGIVFSATGDFKNTYYFPQDYVEAQIGAVASLT